MSRTTGLLLSLTVACDAAKVTFKTYAAKCGGEALTTTTYDALTAAPGGGCFDATTHSTKAQYCDEAANTFVQEYYAGKVCAGTATAQTFPLGKCTNGLGEDTTYGTIIATCDFSTPSTPCFGRETNAVLSSGESVSMASLKAGDYVKDGPDSISRIIVNQHRAAHLKSSLLEIEHENGKLNLTPDHVVSVDGSFVAAREAVVGTKLGESEVSRVTATSGEIINPLTISGKIIADGVLASTYPEWIASYMLSSSVFPTYTLSNLVSFLFPATTQAYYDAHLERFFQFTSSSLVQLKGVLPTPAVAVIVMAADLAVVTGFIAFSLASVQALAALAAIAFVVKSSRK